MHRTYRNFILSLTVSGLVLSLPALANDKESHAVQSPDMEAMMAAMAEAMEPGDHHRFLAHMEGEWEFTNTLWMDPSQPPTVTEGWSEKKMIMGGRYLSDTMRGEVMGQSFDGHAVTGYDNTSSEFVGTWIDSMSTSITMLKGQRDGNALTLQGEYIDPMSKQAMKIRAVTRVVDEDHHVFDYFMTMPGAPEFKSMQIEYRRKDAK